MLELEGLSLPEGITGIAFIFITMIQPHQNRKAEKRQADSWPPRIPSLVSVTIMKYFFLQFQDWRQKSLIKNLGKSLN